MLTPINVKRVIQKKQSFRIIVESGNENILVRQNEMPEFVVGQQRLLDICNNPEPVIVECEMLTDVFGILEMVVESIDFPFTKGELNQTFSIKALSDESHSLLIEN